ncbi:S-adenosyl-L-methionine-dependent methyltransferase [Kalaharituber pfeilii]|nr:S-adenosyl-L-methionine-dependent methyltransferase [Kalaharituber pfeilii]
MEPDAEPYPSPLESLAASIAMATKTISQFLREQGYPQPSFARDAPASPLPQGAPEEIVKARSELMDAAMKLFHLASGPKEFLANIPSHLGYQQQACLRWLCHFDIFSLVPLDGTISYVDLAALAGVPETHLIRIARMAMTSHIFCEPSEGEIAHTSTSAHIAADPDFLDWAFFTCEMSVPTASTLVEATEKWGESRIKNETAFNVAFGTQMPFFEYMAEQQRLGSDVSRRFAGYMRCVTKAEGTDVRHLIAGFDWKSLPVGAKIVDVGGSMGHASIAVAATHKDRKFQIVVQDQPSVVAHARKERQLPKGFTGRVEFVEHDFFREQRVRDGDVYLLRMILHDWPEKEAVAILEQLVPVLKGRKGAKVIVMDSVLPGRSRAYLWEEKLLRNRDLTMMQVFNSCERTRGDWEALLGKAGMRIVRAVRPVGSVMTIIEVGLA